MKYEGGGQCSDDGTDDKPSWSYPKDPRPGYWCGYGGAVHFIILELKPICSRRTNFH